jgi:hypothetical protein
MVGTNLYHVAIPISLVVSFPVVAVVLSQSDIAMSTVIALFN